MRKLQTSQAVASHGEGLVKRRRVTATAAVAVTAVVTVVAGGTLVTAGPAAAAAQVNCDSSSLQDAIDSSAAGAALVVTGTCTGNFVIDKNLTLIGHGRAVLDGDQAGTTLQVLSGTTVSLSNLTITGGNNVSGAFPYFGGGIYNEGTLTLNRSTVSGNNSSSDGGGIYNYVDGTLTLRSSTVSGNTGYYGGGIATDGTRLTLYSSTLSGNTAHFGGGIYNGVYTVTTLYGSRVTGNVASESGGGINVFTGMDHGSVTLRGTTVAENSPDNCSPPDTVAGCSG